MVGTEELWDPDGSRAPGPSERVGNSLGQLRSATQATAIGFHCKGRGEGFIQGRPVACGLQSGIQQQGRGGRRRRGLEGGGLIEVEPLVAHPQRGSDYNPGAHFMPQALDVDQPLMQLLCHIPDHGCWEAPKVVQEVRQGVLKGLAVRGNGADHREAKEPVSSAPIADRWRSGRSD